MPFKLSSSQILQFDLHLTLTFIGRKRMNVRIRLHGWPEEVSDFNESANLIEAQEQGKTSKERRYRGTKIMLDIIDFDHHINFITAPLSRRDRNSRSYL